LVTVNTPVGLPSFASYPYINAGAIQTEGLDVDFQTHFDLGMAGRLSAELNYTHIFEYNITEYSQSCGCVVTYDLAGTHGPSEVSGDTGNPKERAVATVTWDFKALQVSATVNYTSSFLITDPSEGINDCPTALQSEASGAYGFRFVAGGGAPAYLCSVRHFTETNLYARYAFGDHLALHGSINNAFNAQAPIDAQTYGGGGLLAYDGAFHQDGAIGRFFMLGATYKF
jgi:iron complex outermembrane receptor protein